MNSVACCLLVLQILTVSNAAGTLLFDVIYSTILKFILLYKCMMNNSIMLHR